MINFNDESKMTDYKLTMEASFPFFRMFLADEVDAIITHFIATGSTTLADLKKIEVGIKSAIKKLASLHPGKMPKNSTDKIKPIKNPTYEVENLTLNVVFNLTQILVHLQASTSTFLLLLAAK